MKKFFAVVAAALAISVSASAQLGVIGGITMSSADASSKNFDASQVNLYHVGLTYNLDLGPIGIQPSLIYQMKGATLDQKAAGVELASFDTKTGYLELPVDVKLGLDLGLIKPYAFVEPFVGFAINTEEDAELLDSKDLKDSTTKWNETAKNRLEYGFGVGLGVELLGHLQVSAQYFMNLGNLYNADGTVDVNAISESVQAAYGDKSNYKGFKVSVAFLF